MSIKMSVRYGFGAKSITEVPPDDDVVSFAVSDGDGNIMREVAFDLNNVSKENRHRIALYGLNKVLTDRTSEQKNKLVKLDAMQAVFAMLVDGEWAKERVVGAVVVSPAVEALAAMQSMTIADTQAALAQYDKDTRKAILGRKDVLDAAAKISKARKDAPRKTLDDMIPSSS